MEDAPAAEVPSAEHGRRGDVRSLARGGGTGLRLRRAKASTAAQEPSGDAFAAEEVSE